MSYWTATILIRVFVNNFISSLSIVKLLPPRRQFVNPDEQCNDNGNKSKLVFITTNWQLETNRPIYEACNGRISGPIKFSSSSRTASTSNEEWMENWPPFGRSFRLWHDVGQKIMTATLSSSNASSYFSTRCRGLIIMNCTPVSHQSNLLAV